MLDSDELPMLESDELQSMLDSDELPSKDRQTSSEPLVYVPSEFRRTFSQLTGTLPLSLTFPSEPLTASPALPSGPSTASPALPGSTFQTFSRPSTASPALPGPSTASSALPSELSIASPTSSPEPPDLLSGSSTSGNFIDGDQVDALWQTVAKTISTSPLGPPIRPPSVSRERTNPIPADAASNEAVVG